MLCSLQRNIEIVALAGFMRVLTPYFVRAWTGRLVNIHPRCCRNIPASTRTRARSKRATTEHGCTVHLVVEEVDSGEILGQARMPICPTTRLKRWPSACWRWSTSSIPRCLAKLARAL